MPRLPPELCDQIIEELHSDSHALLACASVCKGWVSASRHALFGWPPFDGLYHKPPDSAVVESDERFLTLLESPHCTLRASVRFVRVKLFNPADQYGGVPDPVLHRLANARFQVLQCIETSWIDFERVSPEALSAFTSSCADTVRELRLSSARFSSPDEILSVISAFPFLEVLYLGYIWASHPITDPEQLPALATQKTRPTSFLRTITLTEINCETASVIAYLFSTPTPRLRTVNVAVHPDVLEANAFVCLFLGSLSASLEHLVFLTPTYGDGYALREVARRLDLSHHSRLRVLDLGNMPLNPPFPFPTILSTITSPCMKEIHFGVFHTDLFANAQNPGKWPDAKVMSDTLALPQFARLSTVCARVSSWNHKDPVSYIQGYLPECHARGILHVLDLERIECLHIIE
ncbi:hypothetical protein PLICRDRAFT_261928 [Plicaturopsis crispa FD-325 SS-3]|nr:hypothetical protein PLICRDRAFT_261928 [Plicaturopsis crispa FD-325 SS-3]